MKRVGSFGDKGGNGLPIRRPSFQRVETLVEPV